MRLRKKRWISALAVSCAAVLVLGGCGSTSTSGDKSNENKSSEKASKEEATAKFTTVVQNDQEAIQGGTLQVALVTDSPFIGMFDPILNEDNYDSELMQFSHESLFSYDENFTITDEGAATLDLDQEAKKATFTIRDGVKWSDGEPLKAEDIVYAYEVIAHKDYTGIRYDGTFQNIVGAEEYHSGKAETISGIEMPDGPDGNTVVISYKEVGPGMLQSGGGLWEYALPKHYVKDVAVKDLQSSDQIRKNPVSFGPYVISKVVNGESVEYTPNQYYYKGAPKLDRIVATVVASSNIVAALQNKQYDIAISMPTDIYDTYANLDGYQNLGRSELSYTYLGFKLGKWNAETEQVEMDPNAKMANVNLRQAMGYALDNDAVGEKFYGGLRTNATTLIVPIFADYYDSSIKGYTYDPDKANKLLDDAGYKDTDGDGFREDPEGEQLTIHFASMSGSEVAEPLAEYYIQSWEAIGLKIDYTTGRLIEFNSFYDMVEADDPNIDVYQAAWALSSDPSQIALYGREAQFNYSRYASDKNDELLTAIDSEEAFDTAYRAEKLSEWQQLMVDDAPVIPTLYRYEILPINNRVKNFDWAYGKTDWSQVAVTAEKTE